MIKNILLWIRHRYMEGRILLDTLVNDVDNYLLLVNCDQNVKIQLLEHIKY